MPAATMPAAAVCVGLVVALSGCAAAPGPAAAAPAQAAQSGSTAVAPQRDGAARQGVPAPSQLRTAAPSLLVLPGNHRMRVTEVGTDADGRLTVPDDVHVAGWWSSGARIGDPFGSMVLVGHIDDAQQGIGEMAALLTARPGDRVRVSGSSLSQTYRVTDVRRLLKAELTTTLVGGSTVFDQRVPGRLVLVTCSGPFDPVSRHYRDNQVAVATPVDS
ncbi:class F sortase [Angustibacter sp. McL0619]|uniref:class F sortase n=1 Tax=Angustibacter sp. McL0619 TaxID=3415676 RepID=UPI003CF91F08